MKRLALFVLIPLFATMAFAQSKPQRDISDADISGSVVWSADTVYVLNGFVFIESGESLTIPAGTIVKAQSGTGVDASALIVARGGAIDAQGTAAAPIIFTTISDDVDDPADLPLDARGLWGGVLLLGRAGLNTADSVNQIEGIPSTEPRGAYGGSVDDDSSGVLRYISIRYGGSKLGEGDEINGLTLAGVGNRTVIEHIEVMNNDDDGFEFFGGTVNTKWLASYFNSDDSFDYDEGFRGKGQFWFTIISDVNGVGNRAGEHDGGTQPEDGTPYALPVIYNATYIGGGAGSANVENDLALIFRDNAGGQYHNSIFTDFNNEGLKIEDLASGQDSRARLEAGDLKLENNLWYGFGAGGTWAEIASQDFVQTYMSDAANANSLVDPKLRGISRAADGGLDPRLLSTSPAVSGGSAVPSGDPFFSDVSYKGAFDNETNWLKGWTMLDELGFLGDIEDETAPVDTTALTCDLNDDGRSSIADVVAMILLSRSNPDDSRLDYNRSGSYTIADPVRLLKDIHDGTCSAGSLLMLASVAAGSVFDVTRIEGLSADKIEFVEQYMEQMELTAEDAAAFRVALYGRGARAALPRAFTLSQNAPNPFNPSTTINYQVPDGRNELVSLKVYDISGRLIATLVNEIREPGTYSVFWNGTDSSGRQVSSGVYFYRMAAGDFIQTRKMVLLK